MPLQLLALNPMSGNKKKKKKAIGQKLKGWKKIQSIKKNKYNAASELLIKKKKKTKYTNFSLEKLKTSNLT